MPTRGAESDSECEYSWLKMSREWRTSAEVLLVELTFPDRYVQIIDSSGHPIVASKNLAGTVLPIPPSILSQTRDAGFTTVDGLRVAVVPVSTDRDLGFAAVAERLSVLEEGLGQLRRDLFAGVPVVLLLASLRGYFLARKSLAPIASMNTQTQRISAESLSSRLDVTNSRTNSDVLPPLLMICWRDSRTLSTSSNDSSPMLLMSSVRPLQYCEVKLKSRSEKRALLKNIRSR